MPTSHSDPSMAPVTDVIPPKTAVTIRLKDSPGPNLELGLLEKLISSPPYRNPASEAIAPEMAKASSFTRRGDWARLAAESSLSRTAIIARPAPVSRIRYTTQAVASTTTRQSQ